MNQELDIIYYNNTFTNTSDTDYKIAEIIDTKNQPIVNNPEDYYMSLVRFSIEGSNIPIFIYASNDDGTPNNDYYFVTLSVGANDYRRGVIYVSDDNSIILTGNLQNPVYSYQSFLDMINTAFQSAFNDIPSNVLPVGYTTAPFLIFNNETGIISLITDPKYANNAINVYMNTSLFTFFGNFQALYNLDLYKNYLFRIKNNGNNTIATIVSPNGPTIINALEIRQEYQNLYEWSSLKKIVVTSGLLPTISEFTTSKNFGNSNFNSIRIISDYIPPNDAFIGANRSVFTYNPTAQYRLAQLTGTSGISKLDFQFFWEDRFSNLRPIVLSPAGTATIKLLFFKKSLGCMIHKGIQDKDNKNGGKYKKLY